MVLGLKEGLVECATVCVKSEVILSTNPYCGLRILSKVLIIRNHTEKKQSDHRINFIYIKFKTQPSDYMSHKFQSRLIPEFFTLSDFLKRRWFLFGVHKSKIKVLFYTKKYIILLDVKIQFVNFRSIKVRNFSLKASTLYM